MRLELIEIKARIGGSEITICGLFGVTAYAAAAISRAWRTGCGGGRRREQDRHGGLAAG